MRMIRISNRLRIYGLLSMIALFSPLTESQNFPPICTGRVQLKNIELKTDHYTFHVRVYASDEDSTRQVSYTISGQAHFNTTIDSFSVTDVNHLLSFSGNTVVQEGDEYTDDTVDGPYPSYSVPTDNIRDIEVSVGACLEN